MAVLARSRFQRFCGWQRKRTHRLHLRNPDEGGKKIKGAAPTTGSSWLVMTNENVNLARYCDGVGLVVAEVGERTISVPKKQNAGQRLVLTRL